MLPRIHSYDSWTQLEEVWLGDVYPASWYSHLDSCVSDAFQQLTEITQQDLSAIQTCLEGFGVTVKRPQYHSIDDYIDPNTGHLIKPQITPRDWFITTGTTLHLNEVQSASLPWQHVLDEYKQEPNCKLSNGTANAWFMGANVVRIGKDLIVDFGNSGSPVPISSLEPFLNYRTLFIENGGHIDGCFAILKPGLILASTYYRNYKKTFPGWEIIKLPKPTYDTNKRSTQYKSFWAPELPVTRTNAFNEHIVKYAIDWVGSYTETYFELNCLVINESNVIMLAENTEMAEQLTKHGITVHWVPFRTKTFWDGGVHCLTLDIRRQGTMQDYFSNFVT